MQNLDVFRTRHGEIRRIIMDLESLLTPEKLQIQPNARNAHELLCRLSTGVKEHLFAEDKGLYPDLLVHRDLRVKSMAWGFISGEKPLRNIFEAYSEHWLKGCDFEFSETFLTETKEVIRLIAVRLEQEETQLFPELEAISAQQAQRDVLESRLQ